MNFSKKLNIILGSLLLVSLIIIFLLIFFQNLYKKKLISDNEKILNQLEVKLENRDKKIKELEENPTIITKENIKYIEDEEKNNIIFKFQDENLKLKEIIKEDTIIINNLNSQLEKSNNELKKINSKKNELLPFAMAGLDKDLKIDIYAGLIYNRTIFVCNLFDFKIGFGGAVKIYDTLGGAGSLQFGFSF